MWVAVIISIFSYLSIEMIAVAAGEAEHPERAGYAPARFGEVNRRGVPLAALLLSTAGIALATLVNFLYPESSFTFMMAISMFGAMLTWMMIFVTHFFFRRAWRRENHPPLAFRMWASRGSRCSARR